MIRVIGAMIKDLLTFLALFFIILIAFSYVGILAFGSIKEYESLSPAFILMFTSALGDWNFTIYEEIPEEKRFTAIMFHLIVICITMLILLNLVIAIFSDTYARLTEVRLGLFSQGIIEAMPMYKNDKYYGALISATPPFNVLIFLLTPLFLVIKDKTALKYINSFLLRLCYLPVVLILTVIFVVANLILLPFAYVKVVIHKFILLYRTNESDCLVNAFIFLIFGLLILLVTQITDLYYFLKLSLGWDQSITEERQKYPVVSIAAFNKFFSIVNRRQSGDTCNAFGLIHELKLQFRQPQCIHRVIYANKLRKGNMIYGRENSETELLNESSVD